MPQFAAILGATYLELAMRAPERNIEDVTAAIRFLSCATEDIDEITSEALRSRTWWRLAAAYRVRGSVGDSALSRDAGMNALLGAGQDAHHASIFAGWMLAEGRSAEAFTALEVSAAAQDAVADPLADDILSVLLGTAPQVASRREVPSCSEVSAAVRKIGATALLYLHPTDAEGRAVAALCLDPATSRLDILANIPATDPLSSDDPGWPAILTRWTTGRLLVAATGGLDRVALPAVQTDDVRYLAQDVAVSYVSSGAQVVTLATRAEIPIDVEPLFVVNPRGDRDSEMPEVLALRRVFYPHSTCLGRSLERVDAAGSAEDVSARMSDASLLHLACGLRGAGEMELQLAGGDVLNASAIRSSAKGRNGGLAVLAEPSSEGSAADADVFLDAGFAGVIRWQWPVPAAVAALSLFMTHLMLVDYRLPPAAAVNAVQRWMLDPERHAPSRSRADT